MPSIIPFPAQATPAQPPIDERELARQFLKLLLPPEGVYFSGVKTKHGVWIDKTPHETIEGLRAHLVEADRSGGEAFFAVASFSSNADGRTIENVRALRALRTEIDFGQQGHASPGYATIEEARSALRDFCATVGLPSPMVVESGGGLHAYWPLREPISRELWQRYAEGLKAACHAHGLKADHVTTAGAERVLRLPGTMNRKIKGKPRPVTLDQRFLKVEPYDLAQFDMLLKFAPQTSKALSPLPPKPAFLNNSKYPAEAFPDHPRQLVKIESLAAECGVVAQFQETGNICYPTWMRHANLFHYVENGEALFHEYSARDYPKYDRREAQRKYDDASKLTGPPLCEGFRDSTGEKTKAACLACPRLGIVTPIQGLDDDEPEEEGAGEAATTGAERAIVWELAGKKIKPKSYHNTRLAVDKLGITGSQDTFHNHKIVAGDLIENLGRELSEEIVRAVREKIDDQYHFDAGKDNVHEVLSRLCESNRFDPVRDYLDGLEWDRQPRLDRWLITYMGAEDTPLNRAFGRKTLIAGVRRVRRPGCKFDYLLILEGVEGTYKSTALRILASDENFSDQTIKWDDPKQQREATRAVWIHELGELVGVKKAEEESVKSFLSRQDDRERSAYARDPTPQPRHCIHIGTTNGGKQAGYLNNSAGARRFWPVEVGTIDLTALKADRDQLWAEAAYWEAKGEELTIPDSLHKEAKAQQEMRGIHDPWMDILEGVKGEQVKTSEGVFMRVASADLLGRDLRLEPHQMTSNNAARAGVVMRKLGWSGPKLIRFHVGSEGGLGPQTKGYERQAEKL